MNESFDTSNKQESLHNTKAYSFDDEYKEAKYNDEIAGVLRTANREAERSRMQAALRRKARKKRIITRLTVVIVAFLLVLTLIITGAVAAVRGIAGLLRGESRRTPDIAQLISNADIAAAGYDYDKAIDIIKSYGEKYEKKKELKSAIIKYEDGKAKLVKYEDNTKIPHIAFRTLVYDTSKAFDDDDSADKYERNMITVTEFSNILDALYSNDYVLIDINDIADNNGGTFEFNDIYLPEGKKPIVMSQEDVSYYSSLKGNGFASKIVIDENGNPTCEYIDENGNVTTGAYDLVPILESFINKHPDFSYHGARATLAVTGYDGVLGYRTNPNGEGYRVDDVKQAEAVANRLKEMGYTFAGNSWAYTSYGNNSPEKLKNDADRWEIEVEPIVGKTNIIIYAGGADIVNGGEYKEDNEKFQYLKKKGFNIFCTANSNRFDVTLGTSYLRQGRRIIGGSELYYSSDKLDDLFGKAEILDIARPLKNAVS